MNMDWTMFPCFALPALTAWILAAVMSFKGRRSWTFALAAAGLAIFFTFILCLWISLDRPPLRTMGETRLWYSFFMPSVGILVYWRWRYKWIMSFSALMAAVFIMVNLLKPEIHDRTLMPALQSPWFAPHVIVYMFAYAMFGAVTLMAICLLVRKRAAENNEMLICDNLVSTGLSFLTIGMLLGAIWASQAWGSFWSWDPKETWAFITWLAYFLYLHMRRHSSGTRTALYMLIFAFLCLQICWWGINWLPSAQGMSIHTY